MLPRAGPRLKGLTFLKVEKILVSAMKFFGANWRTSSTGLLTLITAAIALQPSLVEFLPDSVEGYVVGISKFVVFISGGAFALSAKDKNVVGGSVQQDLSGAVVKDNASLVQATKNATPLENLPLK